MKKSNVHIVIVTLLLTVAVTGLASAQEIEEVRRGDLVKAVNLNVGQAAKVWTTEAMEAAVPVRSVDVFGEPVHPEAIEYPGPPGAERGSLPIRQAASETDAMEAEAAALLDTATDAAVSPKINGGTLWYNYPPPFTRYYPRFGNNSYPHSTLGKLFFTKPGVGGFVCSAAAVVSGDRALYATAGHCCAQGNGATWYTDFLFVPGCVGSSCSTAPFGVWGWSDACVKTVWFDSGDLARDVCFIRAAPKGAQELHDVVGSLGFTWNQTQPVHFTQTGWPAEAPFNGKRLVFAISSTAERDGAFSPATIGVGSDLTGGSSGGAWIKSYKQGSAATNQYWNGLNSYSYINPNRPQEEFGPYIDTSIKDLKDFCDASIP